MRKLSSLIIWLGISLNVFAQTSPHGAGFELNCLECHNTSGWKIDLKNLTFNHGNTKFPLVGQHQAVNCRMCHTSLEFAKAGTECIDCHTDMHNQTLGDECSRCHTPNSWIVNNITEMHQRSRFPLLGAHVTADCFDCHINASASLLNFAPLGVECIDCHQDDYTATTKPNHVNGGFSTNCVDCHALNAFSWSGAGFNHANITTGCVECHQTDYNNTTDPNHIQSGFSTDCVQCHGLTFTSWEGAEINHDLFPLTLGHAIQTCTDCHKDPNYSTTSPECMSCHMANYNSTTNPNHTTLEFSTNCKDCHTTDPGWKPAEYREHDAKSFPIYSGKHNGTWNTCSECHLNPSNYLEFTCIDCHEHNKADTDGEHEGVQGYVYASPDCLACHPTGSGEGTFNHATSGFPLTGAHATTECIKCHANGYSGTSTVCFSCHTEDFNQSTNPGHISSNFPTSCETCHSTTAWAPSTFNHNNTYPLTGAHGTIAGNCFACHQGNYVNTPNTCDGCHMPNFNATTNPNHAAINIPTTCNTCHTTNPDWVPATFPIHNNYYVLAGAHTAIANNCSDCHAGNYNTTPNTCVGCHQADYNQTTNPPHAASQFPTTCTDCHSQSAWTPANWDHDSQYFPIYSGKHKGEWNSCTDCHNNAGNYAVFTCTTSCHPQNSTNNDHQGVSGYSYNSTACLNCHPTGNGDKMLNRIDRPE